MTVTNDRSDDDNNNNNNGSRKRRISEVVDATLDSVAVRLTQKLHPQRTFTAPSKKFCKKFNRRALYPGLYSSERELERELEYYAVQIPQALRGGGEEEDETEEDDLNRSSALHELPDPLVPRQHPQTDIWGRFPTKEPKEMVECNICHRQVNTLRFAPHLDKCMGIGTLNRAASASTASGRS